MVKGRCRLVGGVGSIIGKDGPMVFCQAEGGTGPTISNVLMVIGDALLVITNPN